MSNISQYYTPLDLYTHIPPENQTLVFKDYKVLYDTISRMVALLIEDFTEHSQNLDQQKDINPQQ